ncbi:MAG: hypothetical protein NTV87_11500 [Ignavibacteriae bacterium]|nr:hypothetical protein [Ignavibacteriota bacterium]
MEVKTCARISTVLLVIALGGLILVETISLNSNNIVIKVQSGAIIYLTLLSVALFYENYKVKLAEKLKKPWVANFGKLFFVFFAVGLLGLEITSYLGGNGIYWVPILMSVLAIGLFFANQAINRS